MVWLQRCAENVLFVGLAAVLASGNVNSNRHIAIDVEMGMQPPPGLRLPVAILQIGRLSDHRNGLHYRTVDSGQHVIDVAATDLLDRLKLLGQLTDDFLEQLRLEDFGRLAQRAKRRPNFSFRCTFLSSLAYCNARSDVTTGLRMSPLFPFGARRHRGGSRMG